MKNLIFLLAILAGFTLRAQQIKVEGDKNADYSHYKTYRFGEGQITTPKDKRIIPDATIHGWIKKAMNEELGEKGLKLADSADVVISYLAGSEERSDIGSVGPLGMTPGSTTQNYTRDYQQGSLVIDINDSKTGKLIWRVNAITNSNQQEGEREMDEIVEKGFKKLNFKPKKGKKK